jgi:hypothetical protein
MVDETAKLTKCHVTIRTLNSTQDKSTSRAAWF